MIPGVQIGTVVRRVAGQIADGQRGHIVAVDGGLAVQLDRGTHKGAEVIVVPYRPEVWHVEQQAPLHQMQLGRITYEADRALRVARGEYGAKEWQSQREQDRIRWAQVGPPEGDNERRALYAGILRALAVVR